MFLHPALDVTAGRLRDDQLRGFRTTGSGRELTADEVRSMCRAAAGRGYRVVPMCDRYSAVTGECLGHEEPQFTERDINACLAEGI